MKNLYAYYGLPHLNTVDSPGHYFYNIGLMDSIATTYSIDTFEFYSYFPENIVENEIEIPFPDTPHGKIYEKYSKKLINSFEYKIENILNSIKNREYNYLFLKARFRNLSALSKKWKDAKEFEDIIDIAISSGYKKNSIIILDTDLSLPNSFIEKYSESITIIIPSIDFPAISVQFLNECVLVNNLIDTPKSNKMIYYGNIDTSKYKSGNEKSTILKEILLEINNIQDSIGLLFSTITKSGIQATHDDEPILRKNRLEIWNELEKSSMMLNVTKNKYCDVKFIPARVYEAMIFGMIPISYNYDFLSPTFSFNTIDDFTEIIKYLNDCSIDDLKNAYLHFINDYLSYSINIGLNIDK